MSIIRSIKKEPIVFRLFCLALMGTGLFAIFSFDKRYFGIVSFIIGFGLLIATSTIYGLEINIEKTSYRKISSFLGIVFGTWNKIPETEYLSILKTKQSRQFVGSGPYLTNLTFIIYSFAGNRKPIVIFQTDD